MRIESLSSQQVAERLNRIAQEKDDQTQTFSDSLKQALQSVDQLTQDARTAGQDVLTGTSDQLHTAILAAEKAEMALRVTLQVRNKALEAYQEIMRMQV